MHFKYVSITVFFSKLSYSHKCSVILCICVTTPKHTVFQGYFTQMKRNKKKNRFYAAIGNSKVKSRKVQCCKTDNIVKYRNDDDKKICFENSLNG